MSKISINHVGAHYTKNGIMVDIISKQLTKKGIFEVTFQLANGQIYTVGFPTDKFYEQDLHVKFMISNSLPCTEEEYKTDFIKHMIGRLEELLEKPLYIMPDKDQERIRIGNSIKNLRDELGMEAKELAKKSDMDAANLSRIEQGKFSTGIDTLCKIATALDSKVEIIPSEHTIIKGADKRDEVYKLISDLIQINMSDISKNTQLFYGAGIVVSDKPVQNELLDFYGKVYVVTPFAKELSWTIERLRDIFSDNIKYWNREPFYGTIAETANMFIAKDKNNLMGLLMAVIAAALTFKF